jgi:phosphate transport system substrate-binding protein
VNKITTNLLGVLAVGAVSLATIGSARAVDISGAGSTFAYPVFSKWAAAYKAKTGNGLNYQSIGSGGGIKQIEAKTVDFGATDAPLTGAQLDAAGLTQFPMTIGGIVPVVNIPGVAAGQMKLTGPILADIYLGKVTTWKDPEIAAVNPGLQLPDLAIAPIYRSDGSGTTYNFTYYLAAVQPEWKDTVGVNKSVDFPVGLGGKGNEGVAAFTSRTAGAIGYVEYAYALQNNLPYALMQNKDGNFVAPSTASFQAAASGADWTSVPGFGLILANQAGPNTWPMTASTFVLMYKKQDKPDVAKAALGYFDFALKQDQQDALKIDYVPLPDSLVQEIEDSWKSISAADGSPIWK